MRLLISPHQSAGEAAISKTNEIPSSSNLTPEHQLLLLLARCQPTEAEQLKINALLEANVDWTNLVTLAETHKVTSLVCNRLVDEQIECVPGALAEAARIRLARSREHNRAMASELLDLLKILKTHGIDAVPFKGPVLAMQAYGDLGLRSFVDLDFMIHPKDFPRVREILRDRGHVIERTFTPKREAAFVRYAGEDVFPHAGDRPPIEPHWEFAPGTLAIRVDYRAIWSRANQMTLLDGAVPCWEPEDTVLILSIHGSKSFWTRLSWVCDIAELIRKSDDFSWETLLDRSRDQGCLRMVGIGLLLGHQLLDLKIPNAVLETLSADRKLRQLVNDVQEKFLFANYDEKSIYRFHRFHFDMRERMSDRLRYLYRTFTMPRLHHFNMVNLPDALFFGYYPIKLIHDYLLLPTWSFAKKLNIVKVNENESKWD